MKKTNGWLSFQLKSFQVPEYPEGETYADLLRWLICVMDHDDPQFGFVCGCLSYCCKFGGLTSDQAEAIGRVRDRVCSRWEKEQLLCQSDF